MGRLVVLYYDESPACHSIHCRSCRTRVAFIHDFLPIVNVFSGGFFNNVFNVEVPEDERYHQVRDGRTLADAYCVNCRNLLGRKLIAVPQPCRYYREGRFYMRWDELTFWNEETLLDCLSGGDNEHAPNLQDGGADEEQDHDQNVGANEQDHDQNGGANEQNADQDGDANEQDLGVNEENADQDGNANDQDEGADERDHDQDVGANEQAPNDQDGGAKEQNVDEEDGEANEQNDDDGRTPMN